MSQTKVSDPKMGEMIAKAPADNLPAPRSRHNAVNAIVPQSWQEIASIAGAICRAGMAPKSYVVNGVPQPDKVAVAIMHGMEVGMTPMASLQSIAVINGMPSLYGDGMLAVVRASGLLEDFTEDMEWDTHGPVAATCKVKRRGEPTWGVMVCARADAQKAGWWTKEGPWKATPHRMMQMRARGWALRDKFADVLRGLRSAEEIEDMVDVTTKGQASTAPAPPEPNSADYNPKDGDKLKAEDKPPATDKKPPVNKRRAGKAKAEATDVEDQNQKPAVVQTDAPEGDKPAENEPLVFENYTRAGDFFIFADAWIIDEKRTEAELVAFGAFYADYINERLDPTFKSKAVREAMVDTNGLLTKALARFPAQ